MCDQGHTLLNYNANWIKTQSNFGPGGEVGIDEGDIASFLANAVRPGGREAFILAGGLRFIYGRMQPRRRSDI